jgi:hypothetical protein
MPVSRRRKGGWAGSGGAPVRFGERAARLGRAWRAVSVRSV